MSEEQIVAAIVGAVAGLIIGYIFGGRMAPGSQQTRELEKQLEEAKSSREQFEQRVTLHFADTAGKLNTLTENYRDVYEHLASGAAELCANQQDAPSFTALNPPRDPETGAAIESDSVVAQAPRDYAPKSSPDDPGVLNERFGLDGEDVPPEERSKRDS